MINRESKDFSKNIEIKLSESKVKITLDIRVINNRQDILNFDVIMPVDIRNLVSMMFGVFLGLNTVRTVFVSTFKDVKSSFLFNLIKRFLAVWTAEFMVIMSIPFLKRLNIKMVVTAFAFFLVFSMKGMKLRWRVTVRTALLRVRHSSFTDNFRNFKGSAGDKFVEIKLGRDFLNRRLINSKRLVLRRN